MKDEYVDIQKIMHELDVTQAEATVLKTKNELYKEWKKQFLPAVKERYARIENLAKARKKSIEEYRNWMKPYIVQYKAMKEKEEINPSYLVNEPWVAPGFGQSNAMTGLRLLCTRPFLPNEKHRAEIILDPGHGYVVNPYDDYVKRWKEVIEYKYRIESVSYTHLTLPTN